MKKTAATTTIFIASLLCLASGLVAALAFDVVVIPDKISLVSKFIQIGLPIIIGAAAAVVWYIVLCITGSDKMSSAESEEVSEITILRKQVAKQSRIMSIMYFMLAGILILVTVVLAILTS